MQESLIPLATTFKAGGNDYSPPFNFKLIYRQGDVALFRKSKHYRKMKGRKNDVEVVSYEVVIVQSMDDHTWPNGNTTPSHEHMPRSEDWGTKGWTLQTLDRAWEKFHELVNERAA